MNPLLLSGGFNLGSPPYQRQQIYVTTLQWQLWNLRGEITAAAVFRGGADCCHSAGGDEACLCTCFRPPAFSRPGSNEFNPIGSLLRCRIPTFIKLKVSSVLLFWWFNTKWLHRLGLCIFALSLINSAPGRSQSVFWQNINHASEKLHLCGLSNKYGGDNTKVVAVVGQRTLDAQIFNICQ